MSRYFSTTAQAFLKFIWKGTEPVTKYEDLIKSKLSDNSKLALADTVEIAGQPHVSSKDPKLRVSGQVYKGNVRLTSVHAYDDGTVEYSKQSYNEAQKKD
ncbi:uncharacterized protein K489DRAFT_412070 [Dissoconium aciculare CBS 342.82]|uniref:Uncharacterized protein n=1 Tax=Dissoconium aciculare CBS 342.82 TaxID=1314786 RepID=A0A6J3LWL3_9PEZI|nr:uncharacterized protein K489DRAFT_412070 [Dissoconium aciculare CBS 342.82]KAF1820043.1 hypothetical protein K489DRAFT_412070 [Dissoconium aciculare CBS 342.82]